MTPIPEKVVESLKEKDLSVNCDKCLFGMSQNLRTLFSVMISANGVNPQEKKIKVIQSAHHPSNAVEIRSFLGVVNYCAHFIPDFATISDPLRQLELLGCGPKYTKDSFD